MKINEIYIGQLLIVKKLEEIPDEVNDNMKPWCGIVVKVATIDRDTNAPHGPEIIHLEECLDEDWFVEDFERESSYQPVKPPGYPFYTPSGVNPSKINPNKAFKAKKCGAPKKTWKITENITSTGRIDSGSEITLEINRKVEEKKVIEFNRETKQYEYVELDSGVKIINATPTQLENTDFFTYTFTAGCAATIKKNE